MVLALLALLAAPVRPFADERELLSRRLETLRRILPDGPNPTLDATFVKQLAEEAHLTQVDSIARSPVESGAHGDVVVDLRALGRFAFVDRFFRQVALSARMIDTESLAIAATPEGALSLKAVLRLPYRPLGAPLPAPPDGTRMRVSGVPRPQAEAFVRDQALALAKSEAIASLRRVRRNPRLFLAELSAIARDRPVVLSHAQLADEFLVRGLAVGAGPVRALERRFERGFFRVAEFLMRREGACHRFEVRGRSPVVGPDAELPLPAEDPFVQDDAPCRVDRDPGRGLILKSGNSRAPGKGPLTLRLREMDMADVFLVLHLLTKQGFLVDGGVTGRMSLDLSRVSLDQALAALARTGLRISGPGPVRRVGPGKGPLPALPATGEAPTASFALKRAEVRDVLAVMTDMNPALAALGPQGFLGRTSLWAKDTSLLDLRAAVMNAAGLSERIEEGRRILERNPGSEEPVFPVAGAAPERRLALNAQDLAVLEFEPAGLAASEDQWMAFAYSPTGSLNAYRPGDRLSDGAVKEIASTDVLLDTEEGQLRVGLAPLPQ